ncbi:P-loop containing nucleoside triphosphate hydrolase protein [Suhomyces tanzawaensis NRRL Y-17324]|uniref:p-loop containing nucleoside triphosphate hydrolase protein n=1 Tax=Suhomyces tanzawaensis NRRL Y-17324 TaxID=984487 RepID=A0A1E4SI03_9ASCO|nr:P-loop containing nucleoside triphosphate hydrolase protein [Suhomyces tanzawaensis NRRL Y-17324]ODV79110.1 P-loop containing nucleoside triphosphate hydrolase protein [Suhomyces tanzawaensis NRRL Y-17324]
MLDTQILKLAPQDRVGIHVRNLTVRVGSPNSKDIEKSTSPKQAILDDVSFDLESGQIMAIMGGSGSGKTTLLNTLSQRVNVTNKALHFEGTIDYTRIQKDGQTEEVDWLRKIKSAYLLQTDIFLPGLTVFETLQTQADLRLPPYSTSAEKLALVESLLEVLELTPIRNEVISSFSTHTSTLSGGEQRRVSMAIQLLSKPSVLFLDEPTTGLDTSSSLKLLKVLKKLASPEYGITVVLSIHQPRPEITMLFDKFCLLTRGGRLVYYGNLVDTGKYFNSLKFLTFCSDIKSPSSFIEYILELSIKDTSSAEQEKSSNDRINRLVEQWKIQTNHQPTALTTKETKKRFQKTLALFDRPKEDRISFFTEVKVLTKRTFKLTYRDTYSLLVLNLGAAMLAVILGWMFYKPKHDLAGVRSLNSTLYVMLEVVGFSPLFYEMERLWATDGIFFYREYGEKYVSVPGFIISRRLAKLFLEDLPVPVLFSCITFFMWGHRTENSEGERDLSYFGIYVTITILTNFIGMASALLMFAVSKDFSISTFAMNVFYQFENLSSGYFVNASSMPVYVRWTKYLSFFWYGFGALTANQFTGWMGDCPYDYDDARCIEYSGAFNLKTLGFPDGWVGEPIGIMVCWWIGFLVLAGLALRFMKFEVSIGKIKKNRVGGEGTPEEAESGEKLEDSDASDLELSSTNTNIDINISSLTLTVLLGGIGSKSTQKTLLNDVSATFLANGVNAIMGPSGSGKTTLLNFLSNRLPGSSTFNNSGAILLNKTQQIDTKDLAKISGYVTQHDTSLIANLTVRETLYFQAKLRLPREEHANIPKMVAALIRQMSLVDCADTLIGCEFIKGISGGEKRRVSIAIQLLSKPKILFLDEPTSGLDSINSVKILSLLSNLARTNKTTIILTIHQPHQELFYSFGSLLQLARGGNVVYNGDTKRVPGYLKEIGYEVPNNINIADYFLDLISNRLDEENAVTQARVGHLVGEWKTRRENSVEMSTGNGSVIDIQEYAFQRMPLSITLPTIIRRQMLNLVRSKDVIFSRAGQTLFLSVANTLFFTPLTNKKEGIDNRLGLIQETLLLYFVGLVNNITLYPIERDIFYQEYKDGIYGVFEFSGSYLFNELPTEIVPSLIYSALNVFAIGLPRTPGMFFGMFSTAFVCISCGESMGIMVNSCFNHVGIAANILTNAIIVAIFMAGTMSIHMPALFKGINYISPLKYGVGICAKLGFAGQNFSCGLDECALGSGEEVLSNYGLDVNLGGSFAGLFACLILYRVVAVLSVWVRVSMVDKIARLLKR